MSLPMTIGICGTGRMGSAIAQRLLDESHPVSVWNRDAAKTQPLLERGATHAASPAALADACDVVLVMLLNDAALEAVYRGASGLLGPGLAGKLVIDMSTVRPETMIAIGTAATRAGAGFVECPVGGTVGPARAGKLFGFAGGGEEDVARARPLLDLLCRRVEHVGGLGAGATMKLAVNLPLLVYLQALGESLALCGGLGLPAERLVDILSDTSGAPPVMTFRGADIARLLAGGAPAEPQFSVGAARKDLLAAIDHAATLGLDLPVASRTAACFAEVEAADLAEADAISTIPVRWATRGQR